jgi:S1-C subfamily serine protease
VPVAPIVAAEEEEMAYAQSADDSLSFLNDAVVPPRQSERSGKVRDPVLDGSVVGDVPAKSDTGHGLRKKKKKSGSRLIIAGIVGGCLAIAGIIGGVIFINSRGRTEGAFAASNDNKPVKPAVDPNVPMVTFTFKWPDSERSGATLTVNGEPKDVPASGSEFKINLPKVPRPYRFVLGRKGFVKKEFSRPLTEDDDYTVTQWESENHGIDWEQDFTSAKKAAVDQHKNLLIFFDASDAADSKARYHSTRLNESVISSPDFVERANKEYICVYIDNPIKDDAKSKVHDLAQNRKVTSNFEITVFPTVVVTDSRGRPFGVMEDYTINGVTAFLTLMDKWDHDAKTLFSLLEKSKDSSDSETISETLDFLELSKLDRFYAKTVKSLSEKLPNGGAREVTEHDYEFWRARLAMAMSNPDNVKKEIEEYDRWKARRSFKKHPDAGAALDSIAALILARIGDKDGAKKKCEEALAFQPKDPRIREMLALLQESLTGKPGEHVPLPRGSGSGFCIATGNYILTNHHVIRDAKKIMVHRNNEAEKYRARLIADNPDGDMAVLKVDLPPEKNLTPIPFAAKDVDIGDEVCAFGWPGMLSENLSATLTNGLISTKQDKEGFLVTNCKIEHGNSGGPLCSVSGCCIAGMVTAKTATTDELIESYGLAIPVSQLKKFLKEQLSPDVLAKIPKQTNTTGTKLSETVKRIQPSVVYVENYQ